MANGNGSVAPVCPITRSQAVPAQPPPIIPLPPRATDLPSAINAINQLIQALNTFMYPPTNNNITINTMALRPMFEEVNRVVNTVRVYNPQDQEQWVDVERISSLTLMDNRTRGLWQWDL